MSIDDGRYCGRHATGAFGPCSTCDRNYRRRRAAKKAENVKIHQSGLSLEMTGKVFVVDHDEGTRDEIPGITVLRVLEKVIVDGLNQIIADGGIKDEEE